MGNGDYYHLDQVVSAMKMAIFALPEQHRRWHRHSPMVLNVTSDITAVQKAKQAQSKKTSHKTHMKELEGATAKVKNGTIGAGSCTLPEMVKASACRIDFLTLLLDLVRTVWEEQRVA